jgi:hypothetical protein
MGGARSINKTSSLEVDGISEGVRISLDEPTCNSEPAIVPGEDIVPGY